MTFKEKVTELLNKALEERPELFLIDFSIDSANKIMITLDGDKGVNLQDCIDVSRAIEHNLDREEHDFGLEVASGGAASPLKLPRQFKKNVGRTLSIKTATEQFEAEITDVNEEFIVLEWEAREPKKIGKGKETVQKRLELPYQDIKEAVVVIKF
jgi:ribosome maturation factor RimP